MNRLVALAVMLIAVPAAAETRVAVLEFTNASTERNFDSLGAGLQSMLTTDLAAVPAIHLIERQRLHDIQAELKLGKTGQIDKATAAKIGKLAGATHLLGGSFVIVGDKMRIDGRLFAVQSGDVLFADAIEGERDAFFELEKQLAGKLVDKVGVHMQPRERAQLGKVHTADFEAFRKYSAGIAAFDDKRYDDAIADLGEAVKLDKDFKLAASTLEEYVRLIGEVRSRADQVDTANSLDNERRLQLEQSKQSEKWAKPIAELWKLASATGGNVQRDRIAAIYLLSLGYRSNFQLRFPRGDQFALDRFADELERRYVAEARNLFPQIPPLEINDAWSTPEANESVQAWVQRTWSRLEDQMGPKLRHRTAETLRNFLFDGNYSGLEPVGTRLLFDQRQTVSLDEQIIDWIDKLDPAKPVRASFADRLAERYREILELDKSTALLAGLASSSKASHELRKDADQLEHNRAMLAILQGKNRDLARELLLSGYLQMDALRQMLATSPPAPELWPYLAGSRKLSTNSLMLIGDVPVWLVRAGHDNDVETGARTDRRRASELRYIPDLSYRRSNPDSDATPEALIMVDGRPRTDLKASFELRFAIPRELGKGFNEYGGEPPAKRAEVGWAFGVQNARGDLPAAASGYAVMLGNGTARLVRFQLVKDKDDHKVNHVVTRFKLDPLEQHPLPLGDTAAVEVVLKGDKLDVRAGGKTVSFKAPTDRGGFHGLLFRDLGYAGVATLKVSAP